MQIISFQMDILLVITPLIEIITNLIFSNLIFSFYQKIKIKRNYIITYEEINIFLVYML